MTKQELQQAIEVIREYCARKQVSVLINSNGVLFIDGAGHTPRSMADIITEGHERRCHEELVKMLEDVGTGVPWAAKLHECVKNSKQALAEGE